MQAKLAHNPTGIRIAASTIIPGVPVCSMLATDQMAAAMVIQISDQTRMMTEATESSSFAETGRREAAGNDASALPEEEDSGDMGCSSTMRH